MTALQLVEGLADRICRTCHDLIRPVGRGWTDEYNNGTCFIDYKDDGTDRFTLYAHAPYIGEGNEYRAIGKYSSELSEVLYHHTMDGIQDEEIGESQFFGSYWLFRKFRVILHEATDGSTTVARYDSDEILEADWAHISMEWDLFYDQSDESLSCF